jgi:hypothetical protein
MKKRALILFVAIAITLLIAGPCAAQCSICTKTASQLGVKPAKGLNAGIIYLMLTPLTFAGIMGFRWWQREKQVMAQEAIK